MLHFFLIVYFCLLSYRTSGTDLMGGSIFSCFRLYLSELYSAVGVNTEELDVHVGDISDFSMSDFCPWHHLFALDYENFSTYAKLNYF